MTKGKTGAHIKPREPVRKMDSEGPLDQIFGIHIDEYSGGPVLLETVLNVDDVFARCPALGDIDFDAKVGESSLKDILQDDAYLKDDIYLDPTGDGLQSFDQVNRDSYAVSDGKWLDDPEQLIWRTALLAQLRAKYNAISNFVNDPAAQKIGEGLDEAQRAAVAQRALELSARLKDEALAEIASDRAQAVASRRVSVEKTKEKLGRYVVTTEDETVLGGLTEEELNTLFDEE